MTEPSFHEKLHAFIVHAKAATYVGEGKHSPSCRKGSHDLEYTEGDWSYLDSYFGGRDFLGEEVVFFKKKPIWAMNYYGCILLPDLITAEQAGHMIKASLSRMYKENRFLGGFIYTEGVYTYIDTSGGEFTHFTGKESIIRGEQVAYELVYHGGLVKDE